MDVVELAWMIGLYVSLTGLLGLVTMFFKFHYTLAVTNKTTLDHLGAARENNPN